MDVFTKMDDLIIYRNIRIKNKEVILWASPYGVYCYPYCTISLNGIIENRKFCIYGEIEKMGGWSISLSSSQIRKNKIRFVNFMSKINKENHIYFIRDEDVDIIS